MIIVSDTTPLYYLILIDRAELLPALFGEILIPEAVLAEVSHERTPPAVLRWIKDPPEWLQVRSASATAVDEIEGLGKGETEAIAIALEEKVDAILMDDKKAIREARNRGLIVITTLGIVELGAIKGLVEFRAVLDDLRPTSFRLPPEEIIDEFLNRDKARKLEE